VPKHRVSFYFVVHLRHRQYVDYIVLIVSECGSEAMVER